MTSRFLNLTFSPSVKAVQEQHGSRHAYARRDGAGEPDRLGPDEAGFIASRESFYMATVGADGWPYVQHRGGPEGFISVLDDRRLAFGDYRGNRQYISVGNIADDDRVCLFFMDYARRARLKLLGRARIVTASEEPELVAGLVAAAPGVPPERGVMITVEAFDWNCPKYITPRFTAADIGPAVQQLKDRITELETELVRLRSIAASASP